MERERDSSSIRPGPPSSIANLKVVEATFESCFGHFRWGGQCRSGPGRTFIHSNSTNPVLKSSGLDQIGRKRGGKEGVEEEKGLYNLGAGR